jgi:hypothetical protein
MEISAMLRNQAELLARLAMIERLVGRRGGLEAVKDASGQ